MDKLAAEVAEALAAYLSGSMNQDQMRERLRELSDGWSLSPMPAEPPKKHDDAVMRIFHYWQQQSGHKRARLTPERRAAVLARLRQGYTESDLKAAVRGCCESEFHAAGGHDDLTLICRNGAKVEGFRSKAGADYGEQDHELEQMKQAAKAAMQRGDNETYKRINERIRERSQ